MLVRRRSCKESAILPRTLASLTRIIRIWWVVQKFEDGFCLLFSTSSILPRWYSTYYRYLLVCLIPTHISEVYTIFIGLSYSRANPRLSSTILPDLRQVTRSNCRRFSRLWRRKQIWKMSTTSCMLFGQFTISAYIVATDGQFCDERFCFVLNNVRPLLPLETAFFETARAGRGFLSIHLSISQINILQYLS